jgi:hypothetical protein
MNIQRDSHPKASAWYFKSNCLYPQKIEVLRSRQRANPRNWNRVGLVVLNPEKEAAES